MFLSKCDPKDWCKSHPAADASHPSSQVSQTNCAKIDPGRFALCCSWFFHVFHVFFFAGSIKKSINKILYIPWRIHGAGIYANIKGYIDGIHGTPYILDLDLRYVNIILFSRGSNICLAPKNCERPGEVDRNSLLASGCLKKKPWWGCHFHLINQHHSTSFRLWNGTGRLIFLWLMKSAWRWVHRNLSKPVLCCSHLEVISTCKKCPAAIDQKRKKLPHIFIYLAICRLLIWSNHHGFLSFVPPSVWIGCNWRLVLEIPMSAIRAPKFT